MNSPLEKHEVHLRGLGGPAVCGVPGTCASAAGSFVRFARTQSGPGFGDQQSIGETEMMRRVMVAAAVLALGGCMPAMSGGTGLPTAFFGSWEGRGAQSDQPGDWSIAATIMGGQPVGGLVGTIEYPSLDCSGTLTLRVAAAGALELQERITSGECVDGGIVTLTPLDDGRLRYDWRKDGDTMTAEGTLSRVQR
jgi:hypothetical protein